MKKVEGVWLRVQPYTRGTSTIHTGKEKKRGGKRCSEQGWQKKFHLLRRSNYLERSPKVVNYGIKIRYTNYIRRTIQEQFTI